MTRLRAFRANRIMGFLAGTALCCLVTGLCVGAEAPAAAPAPAAPAPAASAPGQDLSSVFGPDSQLLAGPDGEFNFVRDVNNELESLHAVRDVVLLTKDIDLRCHDLTYERAEDVLKARAPDKGVVRIIMRGAGAASPPGVTGDQSDTRATCGYYELHVTDKRHILKENPVIYQKDKQGKEIAIVGETITLTQDKAGKWNMHVRRSPAILDPKRAAELGARDRLANLLKPVVTIDTTTPKAAGTASVPSKPVKIDEGNVGKLEQPKPRRVVRLEEGG